MGTRSLIRIMEDKSCLVSIYQQYDGYPSEVGSKLKAFLKDMIIVNGFSGDAKFGTHANGLGCLSAQLIKHLKEDIGGVYISSSDSFQEWNYDISIKTKEILKDKEIVQEIEIYVKVYTANFDGKDHLNLYYGLLNLMPTDDDYYTKIAEASE